MQYDIETISPKVTVFQTNRFSTLPKLLAHPVIKHTQKVFLEQIHSATVNIVNPTASMTVLQTDAVISTKPNTTLIIKTADCLPILITDGIGLVAAIHAGRKGTYKQILAKTLAIIHTEYTMSNTIRVWFGPHICKSCYQIDKEKDEHYDLVLKNKEQLSSVLQPNKYTLQIYPDCTVCNNDKYFSYRKNAPLLGSTNYSAISLNNR